MEAYNQDLCNEKHKRIEERLNVQERRLNNHGDRLDNLEKYQSRTETMIKNLCERIDGLVTTMRWFIGLLVGSFVAFFFYIVQRGVFK